MTYGTEIFLDAIHKYGPLSAGSLTTFVGCSRPTPYFYINKLMENDLITKVADSSPMKYTLNSDIEDEIANDLETLNKMPLSWEQLYHQEKQKSNRQRGINGFLLRKLKLWNPSGYPWEERISKELTDED